MKVPPMVPDAKDRVAEHVFNMRTVYGSVAVVAPGNAVRLVGNSFRDGYVAGFAAALGLLLHAESLEKGARAAFNFVGPDETVPAWENAPPHTREAVLGLANAVLRAAASALSERKEEI